MDPDPKQVLTEWLVLSAQDGNEAAFRDLYELWRADLRRLAFVRVERWEAADDVAAEAWLAIARGLPSLDDPACFPRWAFRILERRAIDWVRHRSLERARADKVRNEADLLAPASAHPASTEPSDEVIRLRAAIARMPVEQRELLHLFYDLDRGVAEIAEILGIPAGTVKTRLFSVRETIRQQFTPESHE